MSHPWELRDAIDEISADTVSIQCTLPMQPNHFLFCQTGRVDHVTVLSISTRVACECDSGFRQFCQSMHQVIRRRHKYSPLQNNDTTLRAFLRREPDFMLRASAADFSLALPSGRQPCRALYVRRSASPRCLCARPSFGPPTGSTFPIARPSVLHVRFPWSIVFG